MCLLPQIRLIQFPWSAYYDESLFCARSKTSSIGTFLAENVPFTFFFEYDGKKYRYTFTLEDIEPDLLNYERKVRMRSASPPVMTIKKKP